MLLSRLAKLAQASQHLRDAVEKKAMIGALARGGLAAARLAGRHPGKALIGGLGAASMGIGGAATYKKNRTEFNQAMNVPTPPGVE